LVDRQINDTAYKIASALTETMNYKLEEAEQHAFHKLVYETCKAAIKQHDAVRDRETERLQGCSPKNGLAKKGSKGLDV
jgi:hypothetical protein